jgi:hypothetical protein
MLSKLKVSFGNRELNPKGVLWVEIQGPAMSVIVSTPDVDDRVSITFDTLLIISRT